MKQDPRLPELVPGGKAFAAADMPARKDVSSQRATDPGGASPLGEEEKPKPRRRSSWKLLSGNSKLIAACCLSALVGSLLGSVLTSRGIEARVDRSQQRQILSRSLQNLISMGVDVRGDLALSPEAEAYRFPSVDFADIQSTRDQRRAVRMAALLPGVTDLSFYPASTPTMGAGDADATVMAAVAAHFPVLNSLDVSCTDVSEFRALERKTVRHLKIVNTPLILESFTSLKFINGVTEISVGWPDRSIPRDNMVRTDGFRRALVDTLAAMIDLKKVNLYDLPLDKEDREKLAGLEVVNATFRN